jgi:hypothetical protein
MTRLPLLAGIAVLALAGPAQAVQRAFIASYGTDANTAGNCSFSSPCRSFTAAMTVIDPSGEILALDSAGYGAVTITKSVSLIGNPGFYAGISASVGNAVTIATAGVKVTLRGLNINSVGATNGVSMTAGDRLSIENCVISNFATGDAVIVDALAEVRVIDSVIRDNSRGVVFKGGVSGVVHGSKVMGNAVAGVMVNGGTVGQTVGTVSESVLSANGINAYAYETLNTSLSRLAVIRSTLSYGNVGAKSEFAGGPTVVVVSESLVVSNGVGFFVGAAGSTLETMGNNTVRMNGPDTGLVTTIATR